MTDHPGGCGRRWSLAVVVLAAACRMALGEAGVGETEVLYEDAKITGRQVHFFQDQGKDISVVLGAFRMTVGQRIISGRDAVVWMEQHKVGLATRYDLTVFVEGDAKVSEPGGAATTDKKMVITLHIQGRIVAEGAVTASDLKEFPLYLRAVEARKESLAGPRQAVTAPASAGESFGSGPELIIARPGAAASTPAAAAGPGAASRPSPWSTIEEEKKQATPSPRKTAKTPKEAPQPRDIQPVTFRADEFKMEVVGGRRVIIARGNVYLSQGNPSSAQFLELRSQAAVIFSEKTKVAKDSRSPLSSPELGGKTSLPGPRGEKEIVTGVYLENDVIIARGDRTMRAPSAYYDFTTDRAVVTAPVFRMVQTARDIPIYVRAEEARMLSAREIAFTNAKVSTSDFYTPDYAIGSSRVYVQDLTPYGENGEQLGEQRVRGQMTNNTLNLYGLPVFYWPYFDGDLEQDNTALRRAQFGHSGRFGTGVETEWNLFRMLGLIAPEGYRAYLEMDYYTKSTVLGATVKYSRETYSGYDKIYGILNTGGSDDFGDDRDNISAPDDRGRILMRHKQFLENDWELQFELSYLSDKNFLEKYFQDEYLTGKEQETLLYAKKQQDNWAFDALLQYRLNRFLTQTESYPDLGFYLIGQPLADDRLTFFNEDHLGLKKFRPANDSSAEGSDLMGRADTRNEIDVPLHLGALNLVPYGTVRGTVWSDDPSPDGKKTRAYGQTGVKANMQFWRVYEDVQSRLWDLKGIKHVVMPEANVFVSGSSARPDELFPMDPGIETHLDQVQGGTVGVYQRLLTHRGAGENERSVDWMRLGISLGLFNNSVQDTIPSDGRFFFSRPEYSIPRNFINAEYSWAISDATEVTANANYDLKTQSLKIGNVGLLVQRDPRLQYYLGTRYIQDLNSTVATAGFNYKLNRKYTIGVFEQYDFTYRGGGNLATSVMLIRKFPRWYGAFTLYCNENQGDVGLFINFWPEGMPEAKVFSGRVTMLGQSSEN